MANRRMFSINIINSARFLKMPIDCQNLYFHLGMRADDDGVVEAFPVMRMIGSSEDNLKLLHAKSMVRVLNDDLVTYITDWREHNNIRADRKIDSIYKNLLVEIVPDVDLVTPKPRVDVANNAKRLMGDNGQTMDSPRTDNGQSTDGLGKDRIGKDRIGKDKDDDQERPETFFQNNIGLITPYVAESITKWVEDGVQEQLIHRLMQESVNNGVRNWGYINTAIRNQYDKNIKTLADYNIAEAERKRKQEEKPQSKFKAPQPTQITNFKQRDYDVDMSQYYSNVKKG